MKTVAPDFIDQDIYCGIDVHKNQWQVCILVNQLEHKTFSQPASAATLIHYLQHHFRMARIHCAYEAGFSGFALQRRLQNEGFDVQVVHPADIPTSDKQRRFKRNKSDARRLARALRANQLTALYVPGCSELSDRQVLRCRYRITQKVARVKNQIKGLCYFHLGLLPEPMQARNWSRAVVHHVQTLVASPPAELTESGALALKWLLEELLFLRRQLLEATRAVRSMARQPRYQERVARLMHLPGLGLIGAMTLLTELVEIERFRSLDRLAGYVGLAPNTFGSGEHEQEGSLTRRRNAALRRVLVECAWVAVRKDPELMIYYLNLCHRMKKQQAILRIARKVLARIRHVLESKPAPSGYVVAASIGTKPVGTYSVVTG